MHRQSCPQSNLHKDRQIRHRYHTCCPSQCQECACLHTFKAKHHKSKAWTVIKQSTTVSKYHSTKGILEVVAAAGYLLCCSSDISDVLMVVLAVHSFFFFLPFRTLACIHYCYLFCGLNTKCDQERYEQQHSFSVEISFDKFFFTVTHSFCFVKKS